ncbi:MAG: hypothetical protein HZB51_27585 [Chloroflexi bacterium]|nr:hypothetical protein [Chloroflexota bacterium]
MKIRWLSILAMGVFLVACASATPTPASIQLNDGAFTPLGGVQKNDKPTASDLADLQAAESGTLRRPVFIEFYADY